MNWRVGGGFENGSENSSENGSGACGSYGSCVFIVAGELTSKIDF